MGKHGPRSWTGSSRHSTMWHSVSWPEYAAGQYLPHGPHSWCSQRVRQLSSQHSVVEQWKLDRRQDVRKQGNGNPGRGPCYLGSSHHRCMFVEVQFANRSVFHTLVL